MTTRPLFAFLCWPLLVLATACDAGTPTWAVPPLDTGPNSEPLEINGRWEEYSYPVFWTITNEAMVSEMYYSGDTSTFHVEWADPDDHALGAHHDTANFDDPGRYTRFDWLLVRDELYLCRTGPLDTLSETMDAPAADATTLVSGCAGDEWDLLIPI